MRCGAGRDVFPARVFQAEVYGNPGPGRVRGAGELVAAGVGHSGEEALEAFDQYAIMPPRSMSVAGWAGGISVHRAGLKSASSSRFAIARSTAVQAVFHVKIALRPPRVKPGPALIRERLAG